MPFKAKTKKIHLYNYKCDFFALIYNACEFACDDLGINLLN